MLLLLFLFLIFYSNISEFVKIINGNGTEVLYHLGCVSFAPEILADVPFRLSENVSIKVYTQRYGSSIKINFAILKNGLKSGTLAANAVAAVTTASAAVNASFYSRGFYHFLVT